MDDEFNEQTVRRIVRDELRNTDEPAETGRRDLMKAAGALGLGGLLGGGGTMAAVQQASADTSANDSDGDIGTPSNRVDVFADGVDPKQLSSSVYFVTDSDDLSALFTDKGNGRFYLEPGTYTIDKVPSNCHVRGLEKQNVTVQTSDPTTVNLTLEPNSSIKDVTLKTAAAPDNLSAGDAREIGLYSNRTTSNVSEKYWPDQAINVHVGDGSNDRPAIAGLTDGVGDAIYGYSTGGNAGRFVQDASSTGGPILNVLAEDNGTLHPIVKAFNDGTVFAGTDISLANSVGSAYHAVIQRESNDELVLNKGIANLNSGGSAKGRFTVYVSSGQPFQVWDVDQSVATFKAEDGFDSIPRRTSDPSAPSSGVRRYYRSDLSPPEYRVIDETGTIRTIASF